MKTAKSKAASTETPKKDSGKTLVVYATKGGATGDAASAIANTLREKSGLQVDLMDLKKHPKPDISQYRNIVIGGGVRAGKVYGETVEFMKQDFTGKRVAVFICSGAGGDPRHRQEVVDKYIAKRFAGNLNLVAMEAFGGCMRILGKSVFDSRDPAKVQAWAEDIGKKFVE
jgi:menaquinone-dependent protoporphyrinogen oxidase